jgi:hypothetical protein
MKCETESPIFKLGIGPRHDPSAIQFLTRALDSVCPLGMLYHRNWLSPRRRTDFAQLNAKTRLQSYSRIRKCNDYKEHISESFHVL